MSKPRMAGSDEFKEELSRAAQNKATREEIGNDPERLAERIGGVDREAYDFEGYTDKQINMAMQGGEFGDKDYARLTGKSDGGPDVGIPEEPDTPGNPEPVVGDNPGGPVFEQPNGPNQGITPPVYGYGAGGQNINQDNDIDSSVTGDGNNVTNNQDNSINGYGGNSSWKNAWMKDYFA